MFCILFGLWIVFNGKFTLEIALTGIPVCGLIYAFTCKYIGLSPRQEQRWMRRAGKAFSYLGFLAGEIAKAGLGVLRLIWSPRMEPEPELISFRTRIKSEFGKAILANSITLTPGTVTVHTREDLVMVHCLDQDMARGLENRAFERRIRSMEGEGNDD